MPVFNGGVSSEVQESIQLILDMSKHEKLYRITALDRTSGGQRGYLHLCFRLVAAEIFRITGTRITAEYVKQEWYKKIACPDIYAYSFLDPATKDWKVAYRSYEEIPHELIGNSISKFSAWCLDEWEIVLPEPKDKIAQQEALKVAIEYEDRYQYTKA